jgi:hypothetical protein
MIAVKYSAGGQHFGVNQRPTCQEPMEEPTMPVGPFHHWSDTKAPEQRF